jgi:MFS family permease
MRGKWGLDWADPLTETAASLGSNRRYVLYLSSRVSLILAMQMVSVAVGWQVYELTNQALALGFSGLALFLPAFVLALPGGHVADRFDRRRVLLVTTSGTMLAAAVLAWIARSKYGGLSSIYAILVMLGSIRAFSAPAGQAFMPTLVSKEQLPRAVAINSSAWQLAMIVGPALGGVVYTASGHASTVYGLSSALALLALFAVIAIGHRPAPRKDGARFTWETVSAGLRYVWSEKVVLGAISLDLFAVLLGGAVALLPIFARDVLRIGPHGFGVLRSAPGIGAALTALALARWPIRRHAGRTMFMGVVMFGLATITFGISKSFGLSLAALLVIGASDMFSVVVRSTLVQMRTPDEMRGRVSAVNMVFIGASNELGEFESGVTAAWWGPSLAVVVGGVGTCVVVVLWSILFRDLRRVDRLT